MTVIPSMILLLAFLLIICILFGYVFFEKFKLQDKWFLVLFGFILFTSVFQVVATPILFFHLPFQYAQMAFGFLIILVIILAITPSTIFIKKLKLNHIHKFVTPNRLTVIVILLSILFILFQAVISTVFQFENADDMYYIGLANSSIGSTALFTVDPSTGDPRFPVITQYLYGSYELLIAVLSKTFGLHPTIIFHSILPFFLIIISYLAYAYLAKQLMPEKYIPLFIIGLSLFHIFGDYSAYSQGTFLLTRCWQGKSILLHIILPTTLAFIIQYFRNYHLKYLWILTLVLLSGMSFSPIAIFLPTLLIAFYCAISFFEKPKNFIYSFLPIVAFIPLGIYALMIKQGVSSSILDITASELFIPTNEYTRFINHGLPVFLLYIPVLIYFLFSKNKEHQRIIRIITDSHDVNYLESNNSQVYCRVLYWLPDLLEIVLVITNRSWFRCFPGRYSKSKKLPSGNRNYFIPGN